MKATQFGLFAIAVLAWSWTQAAEIRVISTVGVRAVLDQARESFEDHSNDRLNVAYGTSAVLNRELERGELFDVAILTQPMIEQLASQGKVARTPLALVARIGMGVAVKAGPAKPFIGTRAAMRDALLQSGEIAYTKDGQSGAAAKRLFEVLDIAAQMKNRTHLDTRPAGGVLAVAEGKATLGIALMSEIAADSRVALVGPLPSDLQTYVVFAAGMSTSTREPDACRAFIEFLGTPEVRQKFRDMGMERE